MTEDRLKELEADAAVEPANGDPHAPAVLELVAEVRRLQAEAPGKLSCRLPGCVVWLNKRIAALEAQLGATQIYLDEADKNTNDWIKVTDDWIKVCADAELSRNAFQDQLKAAEGLLRRWLTATVGEPRECRPETMVFLFRPGR